MSKKRKTLMVLMVFVVSMVFLPGCTENGNGSGSEEAIAEVNGISVTATEFNLIKATHELRGEFITGESTDEEILKTIVRRKVLGHEARERELGITDEELQKVMDDFKDSEPELTQEQMELLQDKGFDSFDEFLEAYSLNYESFEEFGLASIRYFHRDMMDTMKLENAVRVETYDRMKQELQESEEDFGEEELWIVERQHRRVAEQEITRILQNAELQILDPELGVSRIDFPMVDLDDRILTFEGESDSWVVLYIQDNDTGAEDQLRLLYQGEDEPDSVIITRFSYESDGNHGGTRTMWLELDEENAAYVEREVLDLHEDEILTATIEWQTAQETVEETLEETLEIAIANE